MKNHQTPMRHVLCVASLLAAANAGTVFAADTAPNPATTTTTARETGQLTRGDRRFVDKLAKLGMEEVALSQLAVTQATRPEVRAFAQELVDAHEKVNRELARLASSKGVVLPVADTKLDKWSKKNGKEFDEDYLEKMIDAHEDSIDLLESHADKADDAELASFARTNLPAMEAHLVKAKSLESSVD